VPEPITSDAWLTAATAAVATAVDDLVADFVRDPHRHRVRPDLRGALAVALTRGAGSVPAVGTDELDLAVIAPDTGVAVIAVEVGLNDGVRELHAAHRRIAASGVPVGFLVHLSRGAGRDPLVEQYLGELAQDGRLGVAYAHVEPGLQVVKTVAGTLTEAAA
jgi:hypothetical protein